MEFLIYQEIDLGRVNPVYRYEQPMEHGDGQAHRWCVAIRKDGKAADLTGMNAKCYVTRAANAAEKAEGVSSVSVIQDANVDAEGGTVECTFESGCYAGVGAMKCVMRLYDGAGSAMATAKMTAVLERSTSDAVYDPEGLVPSMEALLAQIATIEAATKNAAEAAGAANTAAERADESAERADDAAQAIEGMTVSAQSAAAPGAAISERNGVKHIVFDLVTPRITFEVETGAAGTNVELEQSGTPENPVVKLTIPRGDTGNIDGLDYYEGNPAALGEATPGTANGVARGNHVHPMPTAEQVGARPSTWTPTAEQVGARPSTWTPSAEDVGARPNTWTPTAEQVGARPSTWTPSAADVGALEKNAQAVDSAKLGGNAPEYYMPDYGRGAVLWEGEWSSGVITVPNTDRYTGFQIIMVDISSTILALKNDGKIRGIGGYSSSSTAYSYHFSANCNGDEWTFSSCKSITHAPSGDHGDSSERAVAKIVGLF